MNILITGANGFIGQALCKRLIADGHNVRGAVRSAAQMTLLPSDGEGTLVGDIGRETDWSEALDGIECVVHLAARVHIMSKSAADRLSVFREVNVEGTKRLAQQAAEAGVKRLVYVSSVKVNGEDNSEPYTEMDMASPRDPYGISKWEAEQVLYKIASDKGLEVVVLRLPLVYGPGVKANFLRLLKLIHKCIPLPFGLVHNRRSMLYLGNLVSAIMTCLKHPGAAGETFLISDGEDISTVDLVRKMASAMDRRSVLLPVSLVMLKALGTLTGKKADIDRLTGSLCLDSSKIRVLLDWQAPYTIEQGIQETVDWYQSFMFTLNKGF